MLKKCYLLFFNKSPVREKYSRKMKETRSGKDNLAKYDQADPCENIILRNNIKLTLVKI